MSVHEMGDDKNAFRLDEDDMSLDGRIATVGGESQLDHRGGSTAAGAMR